MRIIGGKEYVVTVSPTVMDGQVVRWYPSLAHAQRHHEIVSASRNGVGFGRDVLLAAEIPSFISLVKEARHVADRLRGDSDESYLATHERRFGSDLREVTHA